MKQSQFYFIISYLSLISCQIAKTTHWYDLLFPVLFAAMAIYYSFVKKD